MTTLNLTCLKCFSPVSTLATARKLLWPGSPTIYWCQLMLAHHLCSFFLISLQLLIRLTTTFFFIAYTPSSDSLTQLSTGSPPTSLTELNTSSWEKPSLTHSPSPVVSPKGHSSAPPFTLCLLIPLNFCIQLYLLKLAFCFPTPASCPLFNCVSVHLLYPEFSSFTQPDNKVSLLTHQCLYGNAPIYLKELITPQHSSRHLRSGQANVMQILRTKLRTMETEPFATPLHVFGMLSLTTWEHRWPWTLLKRPKNLPKKAFLLI